MLTKAATPRADKETQFRVYLGYLEDLRLLIAGRYGEGPGQLLLLYPEVLNLGSVMGIQRRKTSEREEKDLQRFMHKAWRAARRLRMELEDLEYSEEVNATIPVHAYYAVYFGILSFAVASGQLVPSDHRTGLKLIQKESNRKTLPFPWNTSCEGCPPLDPARFAELSNVVAMSPLESARGMKGESRLAMFLRTTREKELERIFAERRQKGVRAGSARRNLSATEKRRIADKLPPTTVFDIFWRLRKKASYGDEDVFVDGAENNAEARQFGRALIEVTDSTIAVLEALTAAYIGPELMVELCNEYTNEREDRSIDRKAFYWQKRSGKAPNPLKLARARQLP